MKKTVASAGAIRRSKPSLALRLRAFWLLIAVAVAAAGYGIVTLVRLPALRVHAVHAHVVDGIAVTPAAVVAAARIDRNANAWLIDIRGATKRIEAIPYVATARITHRPPADLDITVTERVPLACVRAGGRSVTIDEGRRILQDGCARASLPRIDLGPVRVGAPGTMAGEPSLAVLLGDAKTLAGAHVGVRALAHDRFGGLVAVDVQGVELRFGSEADLAQKATLVEPVRAATRRGRAIRAIDLRSPATPTVEFR